jgi:hypothetical protein
MSRWPTGQAPAFDPVREAGARTDSTFSHRRTHRHPPSGLRPRAAGAFADARRIVAGDGRPRADANAHRDPDVVRYVINERARPWSRRSQRAWRSGTLPGVFPPARSSHLPSRCPRAFGAFSDERRIVPATTEARRRRTRDGHLVEPCRAHVPPPGVPPHVGRSVIGERAGPWSRRSPRAWR